MKTFSVCKQSDAIEIKLFHLIRKIYETITAVGQKLNKQKEALNCE